MAPMALTVDFLVLRYILLHRVASKTLISPNLEGRSIYLIMWFLRRNFLVILTVGQNKGWVWEASARPGTETEAETQCGW